jgi:hypothetical protein
MTTASRDDEYRKAFEKYWIARYVTPWDGCTVGDSLDYRGDNYVNGTVENQWNAWQAAKTAIPPDSRVIEDRNAFETWAESKGYLVAHVQGRYEEAATRIAWEGYQAALSTMGDVVAVGELEALVAFHCGMMVKEENEDIISGAATVIADLSAILTRGGK